MGTLYEVTPGEGIDPIKLSTVDRLALTPSDGLIVYDEDLNKLFVYDGTLWVDATAAGGGTVDTDNTLWVAESGGTAHGSRTTDISDPYDTIAGALGDALSGDTVMVLPGTYAESPGTIPAGVSLVSQGGYEVTAITGAAVTGNRITLSSGSVINGFNVTIPSDAENAIQYAGAALTVAGCRFIKFTGQTGALGSGLANIGAGKTVAFEIRYGLLDCANILYCDNGILAIQSLHVPGSGTIKRGAYVKSGRLQALDMNIGNANVTYGIEVDTGGIAVLISLNLFNLKNGLLVTGNDAQIDALGGKIQTTSTLGGAYDPLSAPDYGIESFTGRSLVAGFTKDLASATIRITAQMEPNFSFNNTLAPNAASSDFVVNAMQATTDTREASQRLLGTDSQIGFPEKGGKLMTGEGGPNATFNTVFQITTPGVFQADVTAAAASSDTGTPFGFNTGIVGDCIAWCSTRRDGVTADLLKTFGIVMTQRTASTGSGAYVFEVWDGFAWVEVGVESISEAEQYRYANDVFLRSSSVEQIRLGVDSTTTWATSTINSVTGYWARVRITGLPTAAPDFYQLKTTPNLTMWNEKGQKTSHGLAMWRNTLFGVGNTWGDGTGGGTGMKDTDPTDVSSLNWTQKNKKSRFESAGANNTFQFGIPGGICTAYPIKFNLSVSTPTGSTLIDASITLRALPLKLEGVNSADPSGSIVPIPRLLANATNYTTAVPQVVTLTDETIPLNKVKTTTFSFDISDYYEDDMLLLNIIANNGSGGNLTPANCLDMWTLTIEGVSFTEGKIL